MKHLASAFVVKPTALGGGLPGRCDGGAGYVSAGISGGTLVMYGYVPCDDLVDLDNDRWNGSLSATTFGYWLYVATCPLRDDCFVGLRRKINFSPGYRI